MFSKGQKMRVRERVKYGETNYILCLLVESVDQPYFTKRMYGDEITVDLDKCYNDEWKIQEVVIDKSRYIPITGDRVCNMLDDQCGRKISMDAVRRFMRNRKVSCQILNDGGEWKDIVDYMWEKCEDLVKIEKMVDLVSEMV